jgi:hypothetical protein
MQHKSGVVKQPAAILTFYIRQLPIIYRKEILAGNSRTASSIANCIREKSFRRGRSDVDAFVWPITAVMDGVQGGIGQVFI